MLSRLCNVATLAFLVRSCSGEQSPDLANSRTWPYPELPLAPGSPLDCHSYRNWVDMAARRSESPYATEGLNSCGYVAGAYWVDVEDLMRWNPSLGEDRYACKLEPGFMYCVVRDEPPELDTTLDDCLDVDDLVVPPGTVSICACFTRIQGHDCDSYSCSAMAEDFSVTVADLVTWNPWIGLSNCNLGLYHGLDHNAERPVCVGVNLTARAEAIQLYDASFPPPSCTLSKPK